MPVHRALTFLVVSIAALAAPPGARAQHGALLTLEGAGSMAVSDPQRDRFGPGGSAAVGGFYAVAPWLLGGAKLRTGLLSDAEAGVPANQVEPGIGTFHTLSALLRLRPFASSAEGRRSPGLFMEVGPSAVLTGKLVRAGFDAGLGFGFDLGGATLAPIVRYLQVVQPSDPLSDEDARVLMLGAELALLDAARPAPEPIVKPPSPAPARQDRDGDGRYDDEDACPNEAEDPDGHQDDDGCPESDNDGDGVKDASDRCPNEPEDVDTFEDEDGCPDPDNDRDAFLDADDQCPNEAEVINGTKDYDGCPDEGLIEMRDDRIVLEEQVLFDFERARVRSAARPVLQAIVDLYEQHPEWMKIRIEGHADVRGDEAFNQELSERRAANVRKALIKLGIPEAMIESAGYGSTRPRDKRDDPGAHRRNRRVEFVVVARVPQPQQQPQGASAGQGDGTAPPEAAAAPPLTPAEGAAP